MNPNPPPTAQPFSAPPPPAGKSAAMAITAFILSFFGCLVVPAIASFVLGLIVLIKGKGGKGFAIAALVLSVVSPLAAAAAAAAMAGPRLEEARHERAILDLKTIRNALKLYYAKNGSYPEAGTGLRVLVDEQYLSEIRDPWGNDYVYAQEGGAPIVKCYGRDGREGGGGPDTDITDQL